ncbi:unnamed protein product, partial [Chrysoparadoxa australica]
EFLLWENALEKLKALDYESRFCEIKNLPPFTRTFFALPGENASLQFRAFQDIASWLVTEATGDPDLYKIDKYDDPNTSVSKLILALKALSFGLDFPASKLKQGYGEPVCSALDFLADLALKAHNFTFQRPVYQEEDMAEEAEVDESADLGEVPVEDEIDEIEEEEAVFTERARPELEDEDDLHQSQVAMLETRIDPLEWKKELERVGPKLKFAQRSTKEWRGHVEQTKLHEKTIQSTLPEASSKMTVMSSEVKNMLDSMRSKERYLSNNYQELCEEYQQLREKTKAAEAKHQGATTVTAELTSQLAEISEEVEELKESMNDRGSKMSESSPLIALKQSMQHVKGEIKTFDLRIGVVSNALISMRMRLDKVRDGKERPGLTDTSTELLVE